MFGILSSEYPAFVLGEGPYAATIFPETLGAELTLYSMTNLRRLAGEGQFTTTDENQVGFKLPTRKKAEVAAGKLNKLLGHKTS